MIVEVPRPEVDPTTVVSHVFPSGTRFPENQLKLYIAFSASDERGRRARAHPAARQHRDVRSKRRFFHFGTEFWDYDHQRYTVFFDPGRGSNKGSCPTSNLVAHSPPGERYTLVVDPTWPDAEGSRL